MWNIYNIMIFNGFKGRLNILKQKQLDFYQI